MAELGQTKDPRELVPGDPEKIEDSAAAIRRLSARFRQVSEDLDRIRISRWSGEASAAFHTAFSPQAAQWRTTSTVFTESAAALESYAQSLRRAQQKAADSITLWQQGEATTQASEREESAAPGAPTPDPGEQDRESARSLLAQARSELNASGSEVARMISSSETAANARGSLVKIAEAIMAPPKETTKTSAQGPSATASATGPTSTGGLGKLQASANLASASMEHTSDNGFQRSSTKAQASLGASGTASASATNSGMSGRIEASAGATASAEHHQDFGPIGQTAALNGFAGARAGAGVTAGPKEINASADAFAGARGTVKGGADIGGIGINETAEGWAGAGAEAKAQFGKGDDGKWHVGASAGVSPILGGKLGAEFTVDPAKVERTAGQASEAISHLPSTMEHATGAAERKISGWVH